MDIDKAKRIALRLAQGEIVKTTELRDITEFLKYELTNIKNNCDVVIKQLKGI